MTALAAAARRWRVRDIVLLVPKIVLTALLTLAIADMIVGVFLRYVVTEITDWLDLDPINFFWVEEVGEYTLAWLTMIGAGIAIAERAHFTLHVLTHRFPLPAQRAIHVATHLLIAGFGGLAALVRHEAGDRQQRADLAGIGDQSRLALCRAGGRRRADRALRLAAAFEPLPALDASAR